MEKENLNIERYIYNKDGAVYKIYPIPEKDNTIGFYIEKEGYGIMSYAVGIDKKDLDCSIEEFINKNLNSWITMCEFDIMG